MSYQRRLELEALPAEEGWGKWNGVIGFATEFAERKWLQPVTLWIATANGPSAQEAYRYENLRFAKDKKPVDERWFSHTVWHSNTQYTDYSVRAVPNNLESICAESREELCKKVSLFLKSQLESLRKQVAVKKELLTKFK